MKYLSVFGDVKIPVDYASTQTYALLAKRDGGKTYTTLLFEEQLCDAGLFFVTLDPVGKHWALRAGQDGSPHGGKPDVWVLGGLHGDVPLEPASGALIADVVVDHPGQYVLDVSTFDTDADQDRFALAFAQRLFRRKAKDPGFPITLILEEAEAFIPERYTSGQQKMLGAFGRIMRQGRNHGLGMWMVAQRAQALNKGVLSQAEVLIVKQMAHPRDLDAVEAWVKANGTPEERKEMMESVASLEQDEAYVWSPSWLRVFRRTRVPARTTFDSSASVKGGQSARSVELVPLDVEELGKSIAQTAERVKAEDPKELKKRVAELERQVREAPAEFQVERVEVEIEVPTVPEDVIKAALEFDSVEGEVGAVVNQLESLSRRARSLISAVQGVPDAPRRKVPTPPERKTPSPRAAPPRPVPRSPSPESSNGSLPPARQRILDALAKLEVISVTQPSKLQVALFAGASPKSSAFHNNVSGMRSSGLIDYPMKGLVSLTTEGRGLAAWDPTPSTSEDIHRYVRSLVSPARWRILEQLIDVYPDELEKNDLAERAGASSASSAFHNNVSGLRSLGLLDYPMPGWTVATPVLFVGR